MITSGFFMPFYTLVGQTVSRAYRRRAGRRPLTPADPRATRDSPHEEPGGGHAVGLWPHSVVRPTDRILNLAPPSGSTPTSDAAQAFVSSCGLRSPHIQLLELIPEPLVVGIDSESLEQRLPGSLSITLRVISILRISSKAADTASTTHLLRPPAAGVLVGGDILQESARSVQIIDDSCAAMPRTEEVGTSGIA